ncbi:MAG: hypothetical protein IJ080_04205 [Oscillospiraceae bacterium]|nr:hypothetical protein [Oscillospiraceae bacterium]MBQ8978952.1 hypothetical protein [Oscillospiraceae bacterium]
MAYTLNNVDEAVDGKYLVVRNKTGQAKVGTMVHIMSAKQSSDGRIDMGYRVTGTGQNYTARFDSIKDFCSWARPDTFIARYYECFDNNEISRYIKINNRTVVTFCLPIILIALVLIWIIFGAILGKAGAAPIVVGIICSVVAVAFVFFLYKSSKNKIKMDLYKKVSASRWGVTIK